MIKKIIIFFLAVAAIAVLAKIYFQFMEGKDLKAELADIKRKIEFLRKENESVEEQIEYYSRLENLEKELRSKFNYRKADEKMMIITP